MTRICRKSGGSPSGAPLVVALVLLLLGTAPMTNASAAACRGDCNLDGTVSISELQTAIDLALEGSALGVCEAVDGNDDGIATIEDLVSAVTSAESGCPVPSPTPIFPADYRSSYVEVRNCRTGFEHDGYAIRVLADPTSANGYLAHQNPLPEGSVIIKEEFDASDCSDETRLVRRSVMRKEAEGFDSTDGNWRWQRILTDGTVVANDKSTCISCHRVAACKSRDYMCTEESLPSLQMVMQELPAALLSISGTSETDVYAVGADPAIDDFGPYVLNYNGTRWQRLRTGTTGALWWISVTPIEGAFYMSGEKGVILRFDLSTRSFTEMATPGTETIFGVWGLASDDIWAAGGDPNASEDEGGVIWHFDGLTWQVQDLSGVRAAGIPVLFKVWGRAANDVYAVGQRGVVLHYDGNSWTQVVSNSVRPLFTVHGNSRDTVAVGGFADGVLLEKSGDEFIDRTPNGAKQTNGVFLPEQGGGVAVGNEGEYAYRTGTGWQIQSPAETLRDFHATWIDPQGGVWAVGGDLSIDLNHGILAYGGSRSVAGQIVDIDPCAFTPVDGPSTVSFATQIAPLFGTTGCKASNCHIGAFPASNYGVATYDRVVKQGTLAKALKICPVVPGNPNSSFLLEKLGPVQRSGGGARMPIGSGTTAWTDEQLGLLRTWILEGAQNN